MVISGVGTLACAGVTRTGRVLFCSYYLLLFTCEISNHPPIDAKKAAFRKVIHGLYSGDRLSSSSSACFSITRSSKSRPSLPHPSIHMYCIKGLGKCETCNLNLSFFFCEKNLTCARGKTRIISYLSFLLPPLRSGQKIRPRPVESTRGRETSRRARSCQRRPPWPPDWKKFEIVISQM